MPVPSAPLNSQLVINRHFTNYALALGVVQILS